MRTGKIRAYFRISISVYNFMWRFFAMAKNSDNVVTVKVFYKEDGIDVAEILRKSLKLFIEKEVRELCQKNS